ncbi:PTS transporter subunit EIIC [Enterococcus saccharolyticus]|uniref:PTS transporter subunit EIIC n=1 Tax=Enterococcus TaxID=1350 RepID=UPI001E4AFA09|nr:PTS transporter subunit EIIC [Enterococcus saccharolyticus]MCD5003073.1 PTS transporter subunit EIIC [Enterococcus saccharolyticus]
MNYQQTAEDILKSVGGKENVEMLTHCATRLRFTLVDESKLDLSQAKAIDGVIDAVKSTGQYQFIIGTDVGRVYNELQQMGLGELKDTTVSTEKKKTLDRVFDTISGIFTPLIPALTAAGMLKVLLVILDVTNLLTVESSTYQVLSFVSDTAFYFLPVFAAISTAFKFRCNPYIAGIIGAMLIHPSFIQMVETGDAVSLLGINLPLVSYSASVIPSILAIWFMSYVEKFADKVSPNAVKFLLKPLLTLVIVFPVTFLLFGPLGSFVGNLLSSGTETITRVAPWLVSALMGAFFPLLVLTGMHWSFVPVIVQSYASFGYEGVMGPGSFVSNICQGAAALAVAIKTKDSKLRQLSSSAGITALFGVTEPALFGVTMRMKKALYAVIIGGGVGGLYAGLNGVVRYSSGTPGLASFAIFIGEDSMNVVHALLSVLIGFIVTFILTWILVNPDKELNTNLPVQSTKKVKNQHQQTI